MDDVNGEVVSVFVEVLLVNELLGEVVVDKLPPREEVVVVVEGLPGVALLVELSLVNDWLVELLVQVWDPEDRVVEVEAVPEVEAEPEADVELLVCDVVTVGGVDDVEEEVVGGVE